jgi:hypothetical protein
MVLSTISNALSLITVSAAGFAKHVGQVEVGRNVLLSASENRSPSLLVITFLGNEFPIVVCYSHDVLVSSLPVALKFFSNPV